MKLKLLVFASIILAVSALGFAQRKPDPDKPISGDFKITIRNTISGQSTQTTTMIKGARERDETNLSMGGMNMSQVNITQCDLKRTIQINDRARKYLITPMDSDSSGGQGGGSMSRSGTGGPRSSGGVVTMSTNTIDTGERKEMFGFNARHLRSTTISDSSPDACQQQHMKIERDGWYINLEYGLNCGSERPPQVGRPGTPGGCRDRYQFKHTGPTNLGFPLMETITMYGADGSVQYTSTKEVIELSRAQLDAALFDVPAGYTEARSQQEMYAAPSVAEMMAMSQQGQSTGNAGSSMSGMPSTTTAAARPRVGVMAFNNKTKTSISTDSLRDQLIAQLNGDGLDAIALNASSASEAAMEAKSKQCAYILFTDISTLRNASAGKKLGGLLGRATGVDSGNSGRSEARFEFRLVPAGSSSPTVQSSASATEDNLDASVRAAIEAEARALAAAVPRN
jgi:hypothetical protein